MRRHLPFSLIFFVATGVLFALQAFPYTGIFLMFALAMFWSVALVNMGMVGVAFEAVTGRVSRWWLVLPLAFYGGYWAVAAQERATLRRLSAAYAAANAGVATGFDPARQSLVFEAESSAAWLTQNTALPAAYTVNKNFPEGFLSHRMMDSAICAQVRERPALRAAFVNAFGFHDGGALGDRRLEKRFCMLSMPERPELPQVRVSQVVERRREATLPVTATTTTITLPDGRSHILKGGVAAPLSWVPMPVMGCGLNSGAPSWDCSAGFWRERSIPLGSGAARYSRDAAVLAGALGLQHVPASERQGGDPELVRRKMAAVEEATLARQLAAIDAMIADPLAKVSDWQTGVLTNSPEALESRAEAILAGLERAAAATGRERARARESGRILARLLPSLPRERFMGFGPRLLAVYAAADDKHWLWEAETLLRRLGDFGPEALPFLATPRASAGSVNGAGVEGLCRVGAPGRAVSEPVLTAMWSAGKNLNSNRRAALFVALRRIGVSPPPLVEDTRNRVAALEVEWADITPDSPPRVCAVAAERQARREEKRAGLRRTNLE